jgi:hypothetical protein
MATLLWFLFLVGGLFNDDFTRGAINVPGK